jgi:UDP-N-acetylmuramoyl-L-alanyl-D-glutamate--2,6-diaminopimelate ligase
VDADRDPADRPLLGRVVERFADRSIITSDNPRYETVLNIAHDILDGYDRPAVGHVMPDRAQAIAWALRQAEPGDNVLIAGKGNEAYQIIGNNRFHFDDRDVALACLRGVGTQEDKDQGESSRPVLKIARHFA